MHIYYRKGRVLPAIFLIVGSGIGIGFVELTVVRSAGFIYDFFLTLLGMFFTMGSGLLWAEATIAAKDEAHIPTISRQYLGKFGIAFCYFSFLGLTTHYLIKNLGVSISIVYSGILEKLHLTIPLSYLCIAFFLFFGVLLFLGIRATSRFIFIGVISFLLTSIFLILFNMSTFSWNALLEGEWIYIIFMVPILTTAYTYQFIIPSCCHYLNNDVKKIKLTIYSAVFIIFIFLIFWQIFLIQTIPNEELLTSSGITRPLLQGVRILSALKNSVWLFPFLIFTTFTTIITSALGLLDFFLDLFRIPRNEQHLGSRSLLVIFVLLPTTLFSTYFIHQYLTSSIPSFASWLELSFVGVIPAWLVINIRYQKKIESPRILPGGSTILILFIFLSLIHFYFQGANLIWTP